MIITERRVICPICRDGAMIALRCRNHPELGDAWMTKNIDQIGARTIFFDWRAPECPCTAGSLVHACPGPRMEDDGD